MSHLNFFTNFFDMLKIPTLILDNAFNIVESYKHEDNLKKSFYNAQAIRFLKTLDFTPGSISIKILNNIKYTSIQFYHYDNKPMTILIGPYTNNIDDETEDIIYINKNQINTLIKMYLFIIENKCFVNNPINNTSPCVNRAIEYIEENYTLDISIEELCNELNINKCYFCSIFKKEVGTTFINYLNSYKIEKSKELLKNPNISLLDISIAVGFNNQSYYSKVFKKITSKTPLEFREEFLNS